jgi:enoyl-CoA hydratase
MYKEILLSQENNIAKITLNRARVLNALSPNMVAELIDVTTKIAQDESIKVLVVKGEGRAWSAGVDLKAINESIQGGQFSNFDFIELGAELIKILQKMPQVTIAMVNGFCYTGAMELMLAFDLVYAADEAQIGDTHSKWGIAPKWGMTQRLPLKVGIMKAMEMSFTTQAVSGKEAERIGLVNKSVPLEILEETVLQVCEKIKGNSAQTIAAMKSLYYYGMYNSLKQGIDYELNAEIQITDREDFLRKFSENKNK